jgi:hypothetical protein
VPDSHPYLFLCSQGHTYGLTTCLGEIAPPILPRTTSRTPWGHRAHAVFELAATALSNGQPLIAADLYEAARRIDLRAGANRPQFDELLTPEARGHSSTR